MSEPTKRDITLAIKILEMLDGQNIIDHDECSGFDLDVAVTHIAKLIHNEPTGRSATK